MLPQQLLLKHGCRLDNFFLHYTEVKLVRGIGDMWVVSARFVTAAKVRCALRESED